MLLIPMRGWRLATASLWFATAPLVHAAGTLDPTFVQGERNVGGLRSLSIAAAADGRIALIGTSRAGTLSQFILGEVSMFDQVGQLQPTFGRGGIAYAPFGVAPYGYAVNTASFDALGRLVVGGARELLAQSGGWTGRLRSDGETSATYSNGAPGASPPSWLASADATAIDSMSRVLVGGAPATTPGGQAVVVRLLPNGNHDESFGQAGQVHLPGSAGATGSRVRALALERSGGVGVAYGALEDLLLTRLLDDGSVDPQFGDNGMTSVPGWIAVASDGMGRMLVITKRLASVDGRFLLRFVDGHLDKTFGGAGAVALPREYSSLTAAADGSVFVGTTEIADGVATLRALRLRANGSTDVTYGSAGEASTSFTLPTDAAGTSTPALTVDAEGRLLMAVAQSRGIPYPTSGALQVTAMLYRFTSDAPQPPATGVAVEYRHATFDHYFVTADLDEIAKLDADPSSGWARTGESFTVQMRASGAVLPVCRFFSGNTFAPLSSHFYTPYPEECDIVDAGPAWKFEKLAFQLTLPSGTGEGNGTCPSGTIPLYRAYNAMKGGAPNHRYTTRAATLDAMIAQGWIMEGEANTRVFACVPA